METPGLPIHADHGPAMVALTDLQRAFVVALLETGGGNHTEAARLAGCRCNSEESFRVAGYQMAHNRKVIAAVKEEADRRMRAGALLGASVMIEIARDTLHKDRFKAAERLLNHAGLIVTSEHKVTVEHKDDAAMIERITQLAQVLGLDAQQLLGQAGVGQKKKALPAPVEAEFTEVESTGSTEGLEDVL